VAHAVSLTYARFDHMSPAAVAMTTLLHVAVAAALWWVSPLRPPDPYEDAIAVTMEPVKPPAEPSEPPTPPVVPDPPQAAAPAAPAPAPPMRWGLAPVNPKPDPKADTAGVLNPSPPKPETPAAEATQPDPPKPEAAKEALQALAAAPPPPPPPPPSLEAVLPPVDAPPPPVTSSEIPRPPPPAAKAPPPRPAPTQRAQPVPRPEPVAPAIQPSPLSHPPPQRAPADQQASRQAPTFQNPADVYGQRRVESEYLWYVARKVSQHQQFVGNATTEAGTVVLRLTIARNGQLLSVAVGRSSGLPSLDNASVNIVRQAGPYAPLPPEITGPDHTFTLPLYYRRN
jgi:protein TonB